MENIELIKAHDDGTAFCSLMNHMRDVSPTYSEIIAKGKDIVPDILRYLRDTEQAGMSVTMLLWDILKTSPYQPEAVVEGMAAFDVRQAKAAWIEWGKKEKLI